MEAPGSTAIAADGQEASVTPAAAVAVEPRIKRVESAGEHSEMRAAGDQCSARSESAGLKIIPHLPAKTVERLSPIDHYRPEAEAEQTPEPDALHWTLEHDVERRVDQDRRQVTDDENEQFEPALMSAKAGRHDCCRHRGEPGQEDDLPHQEARNPGASQHGHM